MTDAPEPAGSEQPPAPRPARATPLGLYDKPKPDLITPVEVIAIALSAVWLLGAGIRLSGR